MHNAQHPPPRPPQLPARADHRPGVWLQVPVVGRGGGPGVAAAVGAAASVSKYNNSYLGKLQIFSPNLDLATFCI